MNKSMVVGVVAGAAAATAVGGVASYEVMHRGEDYAKVVSVRSVSREIRVPHRVCSQEPVTVQAPVQDRNRIAGMAVGALLGGVLGNQVGNGSGRTLATIAGAAAGGYAGNQVQGNMQRSDRRTVMETRCRTEYSTQKQALGYQVTYRLDGKAGTVRMDHDPGPRIPVKNGRLVLSSS
jgi:uncharacterized protein YcfJ